MTAFPDAIVNQRSASKRRRLFARFFKRRDGSTTIEFGMIAAPFLALMFAIVETTLIFFAGQTLETAVADSARLIMTGQAQNGGFDQAKFKEEVCKLVLGLFDCAGNMLIDVRTYNNFGAINNALPIDANGNLVNNFGYAPGGPGDIVVVRLMYQWPVFVPTLGLDVSNMAGNKRLLVATAAFRNEPF